MKLYKLTIIITLFIFTACNGQKKETVNPSPTADWSKDAYMYASQVIPKEIEYSGNNYALTPIRLKKAVVSKINNLPVVIAICSIENLSSDKSALKYFLINPKTNEPFANGTAVITVKGCELDIPAFLFKDVNNDGKDEFIFVESYNDKCSGKYWIASNIAVVDRASTPYDIDDYLKLRNTISLNQKVATVHAAALQKTLEEVVKDLFKK